MCACFFDCFHWLDNINNKAKYSGAGFLCHLFVLFVAPEREYSPAMLNR